MGPRPVGQTCSLSGLRWYIAALLFSATVINYVDRQTLSIVAPVLTKELHLSPVAYASILQAFLYAYTAMYVISGVIVDRWGTRISLALFMSWWSISNMLHALVTGAFSLGVFRLLLGIGEPGNFMAATKVASEWYPPKERGFVNGLVQAGAALGAVIAAPLVVWLYQAWGWRFAFVITGAFGLVWLLAWLGLYRVPEKHPWITRQELEAIRGFKEVSGSSASWIDLLGYPQTWGLFSARFLSSPLWWFFLFWLPKYLAEQRGFTILEVGMLAWLPYITADLGSLFGGLASGWLIRRQWSALRARTAVMLPCALITAVSIAVAYVKSSAAAMAILCVVTFSHMAWMTNLTTVTNDIFPKHVVGSVAGIAAFGNGLGGAVFTGITGYIVEAFSYDAIFIVIGFMHPAAFLLFRALVVPPRSGAEI